MADGMSQTQFRSVDRKPKLSDQVANELTEAIVNRRLSPGDRIASEQELGKQFGVSRTVIREAVRSLVARGLLIVTNGRGIEVGQIDGNGLTETLRLLVRGRIGFQYDVIHDARIAIEVHTAGLAAQRAKDEDIARLEKLCDDLEQHVADSNFVAASLVDYEFHRELAVTAGNELLLAMLDSLADVLKEVRTEAMAHTGIASSAILAHRRILAGVLAHDPGETRHAMEDHLADAAAFWREASARATASP